MTSVQQVSVSVLSLLAVPCLGHSRGRLGLAAEQEEEEEEEEEEQEL